MGLYSRIAQDGLSSDQQYRLFMGEMTEYRNALVHQVARWQDDPRLRDISDSERDLQAFESLWGAFARTGIVEVPSHEYAEENFLELDEEEQSRLRWLIINTAGFKANFQAETEAALARVGIAPSDTNLSLGGKLVMLARMMGAWACRNGVEFTSIPGGNLLAPTLPAESAAAANDEPAQIRAEHVPAEWRHLTPTQVAEKMIAATPQMFEHRQGGKRASQQTGEQTLRQIRWAASLLERATPPGQPLWKLSMKNLKDLDKCFESLPITFGKSPKDRDKATTLLMAAENAVKRVVEGELEGSDIGLQIPTCNKHYRKIAQIHAFLIDAVPTVRELKISKFIQPDQKDDRLARLRYTVDQGKAIFSLPPWTGCAGQHDRLTCGNVVIHDSLFYILVLVWYSGARREEICKLRVADVDKLEDTWFLRIKSTETGRVKNTSSVRCMPLSDEVIRLGFIHYIDKLKSEGETLLFPEIEPSSKDKRKRGDVFYKLWWIYLRPLLPDLVRGQAMHSCRHMVSDELKQQGVSIEFRNDFLGQQSEGGEGATRYPSPIVLSTAAKIANMVPIVTDHLPDVVASDIRLLTPDARRQRRARAT